MSDSTLDECIETEGFLNDDRGVHYATDFRADGAPKLTDAEIDELQERVRLAEAILGSLSSGAWVAELDELDRFIDPASRMGQRVLDYWRKWEEKGGEG